jgi:hypothetical protein
MEINEELLLKMRDDGLKVIDDDGWVFNFGRDEDGVLHFGSYFPGRGGSCIEVGRWTKKNVETMIRIMKEEWNNHGPRD